MARPKKKTVDYFPHQVSHGKTIFILEERFGNDGYAFWFKLLEILGKTEDHVFRCGNSEEWMFLIAKTHVSEKTATEILDTLAALNAIDAELWQTKIVWVQNFVDGIADVYKKRKIETPLRPSSRYPKPRITDVSDSENPQSKVKETKVKERKEEERNIADDDIPWTIPPSKNPELGGKPAKPKKSELWHRIQKVFTDKHPNQFAFKRENPHINRFYEICQAQKNPEQFAFKYLNVFWHMTEKGTDKCVRGQPYLPSILMSGGIWPRIEIQVNSGIASIDPETLAAARSLFPGAKYDPQISH
ncbi:hypothetical protein ES705_16420 [subsurface metagenome]